MADLADITPDRTTVAALVRARLVDEFGNEQEDFTEGTSPTDTEADGLIEEAARLVRLKLGHNLPDAFFEDAQAVVKLLAAVLIETTFYPEQAVQEQSAAKLYQDLYATAVMDLADAIKQNAAGDGPKRAASVPMRGEAAEGTTLLPINASDVPDYGSGAAGTVPRF